MTVIRTYVDSYIPYYVEAWTPPENVVVTVREVLDTTATVCDSIGPTHRLPRTPYGADLRRKQRNDGR